MICYVFISKVSKMLQLHRDNTHCNFHRENVFFREMFFRLSTRLLETGNVQPVPRPVPARRTCTVENITNTLAYVQYDPTLSTTKIYEDLGVPKTILHYILQNKNMHPYQIVLHQALNDTNYDCRLNYCHWLLNMTRESFVCCAMFFLQISQ